MVVIADQKRRIVLPKTVQPGDAVDITASGPRLILQILKRPTTVPPQAEKPLEPSLLRTADLDEPAFRPVCGRGHTAISSIEPWQPSPLNKGALIPQVSE
jgi:hypothetical protein